MKPIQVLDALPGSGKSTAIFNLMKNDRDDKYIYVTPLLSEIDRIKTEVPLLDFKSPDGTSKSKDVLQLLLNGDNIACTHSLFQNMAEEHYRAINEQGYKLVLDEEINVVESFKDGQQGDVRYLVNADQAAIEGPYSRVVLKAELNSLLKTGLAPTAKAAAKGNLYTSKNLNQEDFLVTHIPIELFVAAKETTIITYLFDGCILERFLTLHGLEWKYLSLGLYKSNKEIVARLKELINFKTTPAIDALSRKSLSVTGYSNASADYRTAIGNAWWSVARKVPDEQLICTLPKASAHKGRKYVGLPKKRPISNSWLWAGSRATNDYSDKNVIVHLYDRYPNAAVRTYFQSHGLPIDQEQFALSELIQFVFRSTVRNGKPIELYIASTRMKKLLEDWLNNQEEQLLDYSI